MCMCTTVFCTVHIIYVLNSILQSKNANVQAHNSILHSMYMINEHVHNSILHTVHMIFHTVHMIFHTVHMIKFNVHVLSTILHSVHMTKAHRAGQWVPPLFAGQGWYLSRASLKGWGREGSVWEGHRNATLGKEGKVSRCQNGLNMLIKWAMQ